MTRPNDTTASAFHLLCCPPFALAFPFPSLSTPQTPVHFYTPFTSPPSLPLTHSVVPSFFHPVSHFPIVTLAARYRPLLSDHCLPPLICPYTALAASTLEVPCLPVQLLFCLLLTLAPAPSARRADILSKAPGALRAALLVTHITFPARLSFRRSCPLLILVTQSQSDPSSRTPSGHPDSELIMSFVALQTTPGLGTVRL